MSGTCDGERGGDHRPQAERPGAAPLHGRRREDQEESPMTASDRMPDRTATGGHMLVQHRVVFSIGSNLGDRLDNIQEAVDALFDAPGLDFVAISPVYETAPYAPPGRPSPSRATSSTSCWWPTPGSRRRTSSNASSTSRTHAAGTRGALGPAHPRHRHHRVGGHHLRRPRSDAPASARAREGVRARSLGRHRAGRALPGHGRVGDLAEAKLAEGGPSAVRRREDLVLQQPA